MHPLQRFVRARLRRRLFIWFGLSILVTAVVIGAVMHLANRGNSSSWPREVERVERFAAGRFAAVWDDPAARSELAEAMVRDLDVDVVVADAARRRLSRHGGNCQPPRWSVTVTRGPRARPAAVLGYLTVCTGRHRPFAAWRLILPLVVATVMLWAASGKIARRIARPLSELAALAKDIGEGKLSRRVRLGRHQPGEIGVVADAINDMAARIERQIGDQRELLAAVSHELRTPLSRIRIIVELLSSRGADPAMLADLDREVVEIDALVGELLAAARLDFSALVARPLDAADVAGRALERAGADRSLLDASALPDPSVEADPTLLSRALVNLLDNAKKHAGGATRLAVASQQGLVSFEVHDSGPGFAPGEESRVFEKFYQGNGANGASEAGSLGLGLALVRRIAEAHGGRVYAKNREGGGAAVGFEIPARARGERSLTS